MRNLALCYISFMVAVNIYTLLRLYASKRQTSEINYNEFSAYIFKYAQKYSEEQPELLPLVTNPQTTLSNEIDKLVTEKKILIKTEKDAKIIIVTSFFKDKLIMRYKEISGNSAITFPVYSDLPKGFPQDLLVRREAAELLYDLFDGKEREAEISENTLYTLVFKKNIDGILIPEGLSPDLLLELAVSKIRRLMSKTGQYDYYLKKLIAANQNRDISAKAFFVQFVNQTSVAVRNLKDGGESYYFWNQLFTFIRADYEKIQDRMVDDTALLQSTYITEIAAAYFKSKSQMNLQKETALKNLELALEKPPYYFTYNDITKFTDSRGIPLLGQFDQEDLNAYIQRESTNGDSTKMQHLLSFKPENGERVFVTKDKVIPLIIKMCSDAHESFRKSIVKEWSVKLRNFESETAMYNDDAFEKKIAQDVRQTDPIMFALLNASFLSVVYHESRQAQNKAALSYKLFQNDALLPYSELLILSRQTLLSDAKILLPVWYTIPFIAFIVSFFRRKKKKEKPDSNNREDAVQMLQMPDDDKKPQPQKTKRAQKEALREAAISAEKVLVPPGSSLQSELRLSENEWNRILEPQAKQNLTEDVNALIRDYMRQVTKSLGPSSFTLDRIRNLTDTLLKAPALKKIKDHNQLHRYIELYIVQMVKSS